MRVLRGKCYVIFHDGRENRRGVATHREELEERILENLPLLVLVSNHGNIDFAEILREEQDQTHRAVERQETGQN